MIESVSPNRQFNIKNVERDICHGATTKELVEKYKQVDGKAIIDLVKNAYKRSPKRVRELTRRLKTSDEEETKKQVANFRKLEQSQKLSDWRQVQRFNGGWQQVQETSCKPIEEQEAKVKQAGALLVTAKMAVADMDGVVAYATENQKRATVYLAECQKKLSIAKEQLAVADERLQQLLLERQKKVAAKEKAEKALAIEQQRYDEMLVPRLYHISSLQEGGFGGQKVFVSQYDWQQISPELQSMVSMVEIPANEGLKYPNNFHLWPMQMGLEKFNSACAFAQSYRVLRKKYPQIKLYAQDSKALELAQLQVE